MPTSNNVFVRCMVLEQIFKMFSWGELWWSPPLCDWQLFSVGGRLITPRTRAIWTVQRLRAQITVSVRFNLCITQLGIYITLEHLLCPAWSIELRLHTEHTNWKSQFYTSQEYFNPCFTLLYNTSTICMLSVHLKKEPLTWQIRWQCLPCRSPDNQNTPSFCFLYKLNTSFFVYIFCSG